MPVIRFRWRSLLKSSRDEMEVLVLVRSFLAAWTDKEIRALPDGAWPGRIESRKDIIESTFSIGKVHSDFKGDAAQLALVQELLLFMTQAAVRITQLASLAPGAPDPASQVATEPEEGFGGLPPKLPQMKTVKDRGE